MKQFLLLLVFFVSLSGVKAQNLEESETRQLEEIFKSLEDAFGEGSFFQMDTAILRSFPWTFDQEMMPLEGDTTFYRSFSFPFDGQTIPFDSTFLRSFTLPFGESDSPFSQEDWQRDLSKMMDLFFENFMSPELLKEWEEQGREGLEPAPKLKPREANPSAPGKKRKKYIL